MQKLSLNQSLQQKLSPQQIQFIKLLQVPTAELESRIEEELELNPVLEEGGDEPEEERVEEQTETEPSETDTNTDEIDIKDYLRDDDYNSYKTHSDGDGDDDDDREMPIPMGTSLHETLLTQLGFLGLNERQTL
ncbi:MAG: RNA polymerase sigma-54 factor, partial [Cytophagales bacterium]|nr:RNA polymerase sigma-54 factor [Cytophagales bacterium]